MNTILQLISQYDVFSGKFHFVLFRKVKLRRNYSTVQIYFIKYSRNSVPWYFYAKVSISSLRGRGYFHKQFFFYSLPVHPSSLSVFFLTLPGRFLASHKTVSSSFLKILWRALLHFPSLWNIPNREFIFIT